MFRGKSGKLIKFLWHDGLGMSLYAKRLERGRFIWRIYNLLRRGYRARRLGIEFRRLANWTIPSDMVVNGRRWGISVPNDSGAKGACRQGGDIPQVAFRTCLLRLGGNVHLPKLDCEGADWSILADTESLAAVRCKISDHNSNPLRKMLWSCCADELIASYLKPIKNLPNAI